MGEYALKPEYMLKSPYSAKMTVIYLYFVKIYIANNNLMQGETSVCMFHWNYCMRKHSGHVEQLISCNSSSIKFISNHTDMSYT